MSLSHIRNGKYHAIRKKMHKSLLQSLLYSWCYTLTRHYDGNNIFKDERGTQYKRLIDLLWIFGRISYSLIPNYHSIKNIKTSRVIWRTALKMRQFEQYRNRFRNKVMRCSVDAPCYFRSCRDGNSWTDNNKICRETWPTFSSTTQKQKEGSKRETLWASEMTIVSAKVEHGVGLV